MYFHDWLEKNKEWIVAYDYCVHRDKVLRYVRSKDHPKAKLIEEECLGDPSVEWIPITLWKDDYYNFK